MSRVLGTCSEAFKQMMENRAYTEEHSILDLEFLDRGYEIRERLEAQNLPQEELRSELEVCLGYVRARIPEEFWDREAKPRVSNRSTWVALKSYFEHGTRARELGLGLTLIGSGVGHRTQSLYIVCRELVDRGLSCFVISYDELVFFLKEAWSDSMLRKELDQRFRVNFFALVEIPYNDELIASVRQDLLARFQLRRAQNLSTIFSVNAAMQSISDISSQSLVGRLILPFVRVNKPIIVEEIGDMDAMYINRWELLDGQS